MPTPNFGANAWVGIGEESTWGTAAARSKFFEVTNMGVRLEKQIGFSRTVRGLDPTRKYDQFEIARGELEMELYYEGMLKLWKHLLYGTNTSTVTGGAHHSFSRQTVGSDWAPLTNGLTVESEQDDANWLFTGMYINQAVFNFTPDQYPTVGLSMIGKTAAVNNTPSTPTFAADSRIILPNHCAFSFGATDYSTEVKSISITVGNSLDGERRRIGSTNPKQPVRSSTRPDISIALDMEYNDSTSSLIADFIAGTSKDITITCLGDTISGSTRYTFKLEFPNCVIDSAFPTIGDPGIIPLPVNLRPLVAANASFDVNNGMGGAIRLTAITNETSI